MAVIFADGFDSYGANSDVARNWTQGFSGSWSSTAGRLGAGCVQFTAGQFALSPQFSGYTSSSFWGFGFWMKQSAVPNANQSLCTLGSANFASSFGMKIQTSGIPAMTDAAGTVRTVGATNICDNNWHWLEFATNGSPGGLGATTWFTVDGVTQWNTLSFQSAGVTIAEFQIGMNGNGAAGTLTIDDIFLYDSNSPAPTASATLTKLGQQQITTKRPSSDSSIQFVPDSGATNYSRVNETAADDDTSYVQDGTSGQTDLYGFGALGFTPASVLAAQVVTRVSNPGAGSISFKMRCFSGGTTSDSSAQTPSTAYTNFRQVYNQDPHTTAAWTAAAVDAATFGVTVV